MLYKIIETYRGKDKTKMIDTLPKCNKRIKQLRSSKPKGRSFQLVQADQDETKFAEKPAPSGYQAGGYAQIPKRVRK